MDGWIERESEGERERERGIEGRGCRGRQTHNLRNSIDRIRNRIDDHVDKRWCAFRNKRKFETTEIIADAPESPHVTSSRIDRFLFEQFR